VPLAVFAVVARTVGRGEISRFRGLAVYAGVAVLGLAIQVLVVYQAWVVLVARMSLRRFWAGARDAVAYAMGASSSLATLPMTLRCLDRMKVSPQSARLAACVGTNLNHDGIVLYEAMAVLFVAQVYGVQLTVGQQIVAALSCLLAGIGIAGVPDAGLISLALVLATVGLPLEILPLLLTVDWLLSRCRAMTNVTSDILVAVLLDRFGAGTDGIPRDALPHEEGFEMETAGAPAADGAVGRPRVSDSKE
jgi:DAACS family dicarboxylate/amino acid:cation (Na+ or H+) symporter